MKPVAQSERPSFRASLFARLRSVDRVTGGGVRGLDVIASFSTRDAALGRDQVVDGGKHAPEMGALRARRLEMAKRAREAREPSRTPKGVGTRADLRLK
jgi:hypothetical protein